MAEHAAALGGARLAMAAHQSKSVREVVLEAVSDQQAQETIYPNAHLLPAYEAAFGRYQALVKAIDGLVI